MTTKKQPDDAEPEHDDDAELETDTDKQQLTWMQRRRLERDQ